MGIFDESDSDDDDDVPTAKNNNNGGGAEDEEEDPLEAYMNSLNDDNNATSSNNNNCNGEGRLDVEAEEESTSHWNIDKSNGISGSSSGRLLPKHEDTNGKRKSDSSTTMSGFVRAGGNNKQPSNDNTHDNDDEDKFTNLKDVREHQKQMIHQEIDPLEKVNHNSIQYNNFNRIFYKPNDTKEGHAWRKEHDVVCTPSNFDPILGFGELSSEGVFPEELIRTIAQSGYDAPTIVQSQTLPVALSGNDALITAATGSGKTLAFIWPMVVHINDQPHILPGVDGPIGVVLTPTRELAKQVFQYGKTFIECIGGKAIEVAGGNKGTWELTKELKKGCEIVVSSPGRLIDMVKKKGTNLKRVTFLVLDEADRMLDMGFEKQISSILVNIRPDRQTLFLSATFGKRVERVARSWLRNPVRIAIGRTGASSEHVDSHVMVLPSYDAKKQWLLEMIPILSPLGRCLIFVATRAECDNLSQLVQSSPSFMVGGACSTTAVVSIHGDKDQRERNTAINQFKKKSHSILVATDVAARGLDIENVVVVINFDPAKNMDAHVHRVGRAGRLTKEGTGEHQKGVAYTLLTPKKDANFAVSLADAFEREGREVSPELAALCQKCNRYGGGRMKHSKDGLGFGSGDDKAASTTSSAAMTMSSSYYGPSNDQPGKKKSRWG